MSHGPSTFGSITTSSLSPTSPTTSRRSSSIQGLLRALIRVHKPVAPKSLALARAMKPRRASILASAGIASSRLPRSTSTWPISSGIFARTFSLCGGTKWIIRSIRTGSSRYGSGAPAASGWKKRRGSFCKVGPPGGTGGARHAAAGKGCDQSRAFASIRARTSARSSFGTRSKAWIANSARFTSSIASA